MGIFNRVALAWKAMTDPRAIDPNYGTSLQIITSGQSLWTPRNYANLVKEGYRRTAAVYSSINKISSAASGINWKLYEDHTMKREIEEHPLLDLWRKPNLNESSGAFIEKLFGFWHLSGNDYIWAFRPKKNGPPLALRSEEHTSELQSQSNLVCRLLLEKKKNILNAQCTIPVRLTRCSLFTILTC